MKILILQFPLQPDFGGAETHTLSLVKGLASAGDEILVISSNRALITALKQLRCRAQYLWCGWEPTSIFALLMFPITFIIMLPVILFLILSFHPQKIICLTLADKLIATPLARLCFKRVIWIEHTRLGRWIYASPLRPWFVLNSLLAIIVSPSYFLRNQLLQLGVAINNIKVIYPGTPKLALTTILKSKHEYVTFGYLGRLASEKGVNVLLAAFATLKHHNVLPHPTRIKLLIAGKGPAEKDLKRLAVDLGLKDNVVFLGMIKKKTDFFSQVDCVIIPSIQAESFGLTIIESMMAGLPVIASRIGAIPEIIEHKKTGLLFKPGDKTAIVDCVNWLFCDDIRKQRLKKQAYEVVCSRFTEQQMLNTYRNLLRQY